MGSNVVQSVIDSMRGMVPGQVVPPTNVSNMPGMAPGVVPRALDGGYPGQPPSAGNFAQQPPQNFPPAYAGPAPGTFAYSRDRAFDQAGSDFSQGRYGASIGDAIRGVGVAIPAGIASAYHSVADSAVAPHAPTPAASSPLAHGVQEFVRGLTGAAPQSPMLPEFNQQVQQLQPPRSAPFAAPPVMPSSGPTNGDVVAASLHAAAPPANPLVPTYSAGAPTTGALQPDVNERAARGVAPEYDAGARAGQQPQGRSGPAQGAIATQQPVSDREAFYQTLPPHIAAAIKTGHFSRDQVVQLLGQVAPQVAHERDPVWVGKNASANALSGMANLTAHGVSEDKNGNVTVAPWTLQLPADRLRALGADPANGDVAAQLIYQYNVHKRTNSIWNQFFNSIIPLMQQGQGQ